MAVEWTLEYASVTKTLAAWGLVGLTRRRVNQGIDTVTFRHDGVAFDGTPIFAYGATIKIFRDAVKWFEGRVDQVPRYGSMSEEGMQYVIAGPWWYLEHLVYQQGWNVNNGAGLTVLNKSRVLLFHTITGAKLNAGEQIADVLEYAATTAAKPIAYDDTDFPPVNPPTDEAQDLVCAEVIRRALRWAPDAVTWWDYSTTPPTFHCAQRPNLDAASLAITALSGLQIQSRDDIVVPAVYLKFERTDTYDGQPYLSVSEQKAPNDSVTGLEDNAIVATVQLEGGSVQSVTAAVEVETPAPATAAWWQSKLSWLANDKITIEAVTEASRTSSLPRILTRGQLAAWMTDSGGNPITAAEDTISARMRYSVYSAATKTADQKLAEFDEVFTFRAIATNATTGSYSAIESALVGESAPEGLAQYIYDAVSVLHWEGGLTVTQQDVDSSVDLMGKLLNLTGGNAAWLTMNALVQETINNVDSGTTQISFGPPRYLGLGDIIQLLRMTRFRRLYINPATRVNGQSYGAGSVQLGQDTPKEAPSSGSLQPRRVKVGDAAATSKGAIDLDPTRADAAVAGGEAQVIKPRWTKVCDNGVDKWCLVMRSAALTALPNGAVED
ncbi:MAG TPA: hypothetical protein DEH78_12255 [Solibacterales bacterium]|nr:hypothetical protein [Bryobacterales bacterium]